MENPVLDLLIQYKAVEFGDFTLASGVKSKYYIDVKTAIMQPALLGEIAKEVAGKSQMVIGDVAGKHVLLIEDVTTSGGSSKYGIDELRKAGAIVDSVVVVVDRDSGAEALLAAEGVTLHPLVRASELLNR